MENQSIKPIPKEQRDRLINNAVDATLTLYKSVRERMEREMVSETFKRGIAIKNVKTKYEQANRI